MPRKKSGPGGRKPVPPAVPKTVRAGADKPKADRRGTPKGKATGAGKGRGGGGKVGNPKFVATDEQRIRVEAMVAAGAQQWFIAEDLNISEDTLQRHFAKELQHGKERALSKIGASMVGRALAGDHDAGKYVLARIGGWKNTTALEQSGPDGGPIVYTAEPPRRDLSHLTEDEKLELERLTAKIEAKPEARERPADE
jgi:hypothetical protein